MSRISSISFVNGSSFDGRAEAVVVRGCGQAEVRTLLTVLQVTPYLHCNARFDVPSRESQRGVRLDLRLARQHRGCSFTEQIQCIGDRRSAPVPRGMPFPR